MKPSPAGFKFCPSGWLAVGSLGLLLACGGGAIDGGAGAVVSTPVTTVNIGAYLADLQASMAGIAAPLANDIATGNAATYYSDSDYLMGMAAGAEASGSVAVMDVLMQSIAGLMATAQPLVRNGITYQEWGPFSNGEPGQLNTFQATGPLARAVAVCAGNPVFQARYRAEIAQIIAFVNQSIFLFWFDKQTGVYANPGTAWLGGDVPWLPVAQGGWGTDPVFPDTCEHFGMIATWMYQATGSPLYLEYATRVAQGFRSHIAVVDGAWIWDQGIVAQEDPDNQDGSPDTSHSNRVPMMIVSMYQAGIEYQLTDLDQLAATFTRVIWNQSLTNPMFSNYIDGSNLGYRSAGAWQNGIIFNGWDMLGRHSALAGEVVATAYRLITTQQVLNLSLLPNSNSFGQVELAGTLAWDALP